MGLPFLQDHCSSACSLAVGRKCSPISCPQLLNQDLDNLGRCHSVLEGCCGLWEVSGCIIGCRNLGS